MVCNVFGTPITDETLKGLPEYHDKTLTAEDRARVALEMKNAEGKDTAAQNYANYLKQQYEESKCKTLGMIYNATGGPLTFVDSVDRNGYLAISPYPILIANGQWGVFMHADWSGGYSKGAVIYAGQNTYGHSQSWVLAWSNNGTNIGEDHNRIYTRVHGQHVSYGGNDWDSLIKDLDSTWPKRLHHRANDGAGMILASIGDERFNFMEAIMTLPQVFPNN